MTDKSRDLLGAPVRGGKPPKRLHYVAWGRARPKFGRLYRGPGWARNRVRRAEAAVNQVRVYEAQVTWVEVTDRYSDPVAIARSEERLAWAGTNKLRRLALEDPALAGYLMQHRRLDRAIDTAADLWGRMFRRSDRAS